MRRHVIWSVPGYGLLQNLSTLVGGAVLAWWLLRWLRTAPVSGRPAGSTALALSAYSVGWQVARRRVGRAVDDDHAPSPAAGL